MTLSTDIYILDEVDPMEVFWFCQSMLTRYDDGRYRTPEQQEVRHQQETSYTGTPGVFEVRPDNPWGLENVLGQGLPAWLMTAYRPGGPLTSPERAAQCTDDCDPDSEDYGEDGYHYHPHACWMSVDFDTTYGYRDSRGWGCGDLHAALVAELGAWLDAKSVRWEWRNEFTGEVHTGAEGLTELGRGGVEAQQWFMSSVLPAMLVEQATNGGGRLEVGGMSIEVPNLSGADLCPDPWSHERLYAGAESTWLKSREERAADRANGCPWCGKPLPTSEETR